MGVSCTPHEVLLSVCEDGAVLDLDPQRLKPPANLDAGKGLWEFMDEVDRLLKAFRPDRVALLLPEKWGYKATHHQLMPRIVLETLLRLAAERAAIPTDLLSRPTVRAQLGLPKEKGLRNHVEKVFPQPVGCYWNKGRGEAALAAKTVQEMN